MKEWFAFLIAFLKFLFYVFYLKYLKEFNKCIQLFHRWRLTKLQPVMATDHGQNSPDQIFELLGGTTC